MLTAEAELAVVVTIIVMLFPGLTEADESEQ